MPGNVRSGLLGAASTIGGNTVAQFPSLRWPALERILTREPLSYAVTRQSGSHRTMKAAGRPTLHLSFHDNQDIPPGLVRKILVNDIGLTEAAALALL